MSHGLPSVCRASGLCHASIRLRPTPALRQRSSPPLRRLQTERFGAFVPPSPDSLPKPRPKKPAKKRRWPRRLLYLTILAGAGYIVDTRWNSASLTRSFRTFKTGLIIGLDYKINFRKYPWFYDRIEDLHATNAARIFDLLRHNGGLYLKIGQAIAMQSAILPPEFQKMFAKMFDDAPQNTWAEVERVVREDFGGRSVEEVFGVSFTGEEGKGVMERTARASASVAQVHWARLADGREVAIKIQKREIAQQVGWDLWAFKVVASIYSWWFDIPMVSLVPYITERLMLETDFENEANNAEAMRNLVQGERRLRGRVYIPTVYRELSSKRVMTAEWIEGVRLWDKDALTKPWKGGWGMGSPGCNGKPLGPPESKSIEAIRTNDPNHESLKPARDAWRGPRGDGGLGLSLKAVMTTMIDLFSAQMFLWGLVHCDPHPGNIFVRRLPSGKPELVLIDHGLYIHMNPTFRHQYALFWKSLLAFDNETIGTIVRSWGINSPDLFASATLMRPYTGGDGSTSRRMREGLRGTDEAERAYEMQQRMRRGIKQILGDETKWPKELIFIGRNLRIVQANNQFLGSPVNRIKITGLWASRALVEDAALTPLARARNLALHLRFCLTLLGSDLFWWYARLRQLLGLGRGMDDEIERSMRGMAKDFGIELNHGLFEG